MKSYLLTTLCFATAPIIFCHPVEYKGSSDQNQTSTAVRSNETSDSPLYSVTIYTNDNFLGIPWSMTIQNCTDVPFLLYKKTSSVDTHDHCMLLFGRQNCTGRHVTIAPGTSGHSHLSEKDFDDSLASLQPCPEQPSNASNSNIAVATNKSINHTTRMRRNIQFENFIETITNQFQSRDSDNRENENNINDTNEDEQQDDDKSDEESENVSDESNTWFRRDTDSSQPLSIGEMESMVIMTSTANVQRNKTKRPPLDIQNIIY